MRDIATTKDAISEMSDGAIETVRKLEKLTSAMPQTKIATTHTFHAGMYARTVMVPAGVLITGTLVKIPTLLIVSGHTIMYVDGQPKEIETHAVLAASKRRKQAFVALTDTYLTMIFPTEAKTVEEAELEFTDEIDLLMSRHDDALNSVILTEE